MRSKISKNLRWGVVGIMAVAAQFWSFDRGYRAGIRHMMEPEQVKKILTREKSDPRRAMDRLKEFETEKDMGGVNENK